MTHLEGIKILDTFTTIYRTGFNYWACIITFIVVAAIMIIIIVPVIDWLDYYLGSFKILVNFFVILMAVFIGIDMGFMIGKEKKEITKYKICIIDENITMTDFTNTYEILSKEGEVYTVKFKDEVN